jgi:NitT/TauT family transport system permease protein
MNREWIATKQILRPLRPPENLSGLLPRVHPTLLSLFVGAVVWEVAGQLTQLRFLPPLSNVLRALVDLIASGQILGYLAASLVSLFAGYALAVVCGVALGLLMGRYRKAEYLLDPYLYGFLAAPKLIFVPALYAIFGVSRSVQVAVVFLSAVFIIMLSTMNALRTVDVSYVEMARAFGAKERQLFWKILLPGALPLTMAGLRLGMGRAVKGMINGEMFITLFGLGALLRTYGGRFDAEKVFAILLVVVAVALVCNYIVQSIEQRLTRWADSKS